MKRTRAISVVVAMGFVLLVALVCYAAYHHQGENDSKNFLTVYPNMKGTKLDSCNLCHTGGSYTSGTKTVTLGSCQWCHYSYGYDGSGDINTTLNQYGKDYRDNGRNVAAIRKIKKLNSDASPADTFTNDEEIRAGRYPGDSNDTPTKVYAPAVVYTRAQLEAMPQHAQFMLMNTSKSGDYYAEYSGVTVQDLLTDARISDTATNIRVISPDGFSQFHSLEPDANWYHVNGTYPEATFHYTTTADTLFYPAPDGWCDYSAPSVTGRNDGDVITVPNGLRLILALRREGAYLTPGVLTSTNKLDGEGPFRVVPPQKVEGPPDQASTAANQAVAWPYNAAWDHNAGSATRSATIIKVEPLPPGTTDINLLEAGWAYVDSAQLVIYGNIARGVSINNDAGCTTSSKVSLTLNPTTIPEKMVISNGKSRAFGRTLPYAGSAQWTLGFGKGMKEVRVWFKTGKTFVGPFSSSIYVAKSCE